MHDERPFTAERLLAIKAERQIASVERVPWVTRKVDLANPPSSIAVRYGDIARRKLKKHADHFRQFRSAGELRPC